MLYGVKLNQWDLRLAPRVVLLQVSAPKVDHASFVFETVYAFVVYEFIYTYVYIYIYIYACANAVNNKVFKDVVV